jgi:hypothetical protein
MSNDEIEDYLTEDPEISSQKIVLLSFLSPEKILSKKDVYFFQQFVKDYEVQWKTSKLEAWLATQIQELNSRLETLAGKLDKEEIESKKASEEIRNSYLNVGKLVEDFQDYKRKALKEASERNILEDYDEFMFKNQQKLEDEFFKKNDFHTTIRGIKVRGVYATEAEASARAKRLQKSDPNFNIYMGAVGKWMAWDPDPNSVKEQEYANDQLNTLMKKYRDNEEARDSYYTEEKKKKMGAAKKIETSIVKEEDSNPFTSNVASSGGGGSSYDAMFSGVGDLAIARKMEKKE